MEIMGTTITEITETTVEIIVVEIMVEETTVMMAIMVKKNLKNLL
jgi:hypothetical protein